MFNAAKDAMTSRAALHYANKMISRYGEVKDLKIDSRDKTMELSCHLHGEPGPIAVRLDRYEVETEDGKKYLRVNRCSCTRPWMQSLLSDFIVGRRIELPPWAASAL